MPPIEVRREVVGPFVQNAWLAWCPRTKEGVLVDPGFEPERILAMVEDEGVAVKHVVATHGHIDHVWGATEICAATGAPFCMHPADTYWLELLDRQAAMFGLEPAPGTPAIDAPQGDASVLRFGDCALTAVATPGHTPGSLCWHDSHGTMFTGDTLFQRSIGRTDFPGGDAETIVRSIRGSLFTMDPATRVLPGHGPETTIGEEKADNPFVGDAAVAPPAPRGRRIL